MVEINGKIAWLVILLVSVFFFIVNIACDDTSVIKEARYEQQQQEDYIKTLPKSQIYKCMMCNGTGIYKEPIGKGKCRCWLCPVCKGTGKATAHQMMEECSKDDVQEYINQINKKKDTKIKKQSKVKKDKKLDNEKRIVQKDRKKKST